MSAKRYASLLPLLLSGCGSLVGGDYRGEVLLEIEGSVLVEPDFDLTSNIGVAMIWTNDDHPTVDAEAVVVNTSFPARYTIRLYSEPDESTRISLLGYDELLTSIGQIVLYQDTNGNGKWDGADIESVVGGSYDSVVIWVEDRENGSTAGPQIDSSIVWFDDRESWTPRSGFQLVEVPVPPTCDLPPNAILYDHPSNQATLHVGTLRNITYDWDCDGTSDYDIGFPPEEDPTFESECPPSEVVEDNCNNINTFLHEELSIDGIPVDLFPPEWLDCMLAICDSTVEAYINYLNTPVAVF